MFAPHRIRPEEVRRGDIIVWKREGILSCLLSLLIKTVKEPKYDRWCWHTTPMITDTQFLDAQFPSLKLTSFIDKKYKDKEFRVYRIFEAPPHANKLNKFAKDKIGCGYDFIAYILTALAVLLRPKIDIPRIINKKLTCWETAWEFADEMGLDITDDYDYPFITDLLRLCGEL